MTAKTPFEKYGKLQVKEGKLTDASSAVVQLKGISTHSIPLYPQYVNIDFFKQMRDEWQVDIVRLAMYTDEEKGYCVDTDENCERLKKVIDDGVSFATMLGLYVIIDWHILFDSNPLMNKEKAIAFFDEVAQKYHNHENVIYEICNEPNKNCPWKDVKAYANEVIPVIRKYDQDAIILVGTPEWSQRVDEALKDPVTISDNLMYVLHFYADTHRDELRNRLKEVIAQGLPVFVSEFGITDASGNGAINEEEGNTWIKLLDEYKISYIIWNLSNKDESSAFFKPECTKVCQFVKEDLTKEALWYIKVLTGKEV